MYSNTLNKTLTFSTQISFQFCKTLIRYEVTYTNSKPNKNKFQVRKWKPSIFPITFLTISQIALYNCSSCLSLVSWLHCPKTTPFWLIRSKHLLDKLKIFILHILTHLLGKAEERIFVKYIFSLTPCSIDDDHNRWTRRHHCNFFQIGRFSSRIQN